MRIPFYAMLAYLTLVVDAYLALAAVATSRLSDDYHHYLLPFDAEGVSQQTSCLTLIVSTWTSILAIGCLKQRDEKQAEAPHAYFIVWFVLMLTVIWIAYLWHMLL